MRDGSVQAPLQKYAGVQERTHAHDQIGLQQVAGREARPESALRASPRQVDAKYRVTFNAGDLHGSVSRNV